MKIDPKERQINKEEMFLDKNKAKAWRDYITNHYLKALFAYDVEKAKAYKAILNDIKVLCESTWTTIKFE